MTDKNEGIWYAPSTNLSSPSKNANGENQVQDVGIRLQQVYLEHNCSLARNTFRFQQIQIIRFLNVPFVRLVFCERQRQHRRIEWDGGFEWAIMRSRKTNSNQIASLRMTNRIGKVHRNAVTASGSQRVNVTRIKSWIRVCTASDNDTASYHRRENAEVYRSPRREPSIQLNLM